MSENQSLKDLLNLIKYKRKVNQSKIASELGYNATYLSGVINGKFPYTDEMRNKIYEQYSDCFIDSVHNEDEEYSNSKSKGVLPLLPIDVVAGFPSFEDPIDENEYEYYNVPEFASKGAQYLIKVSGDSMFPRYSNGDILACKKIQSITFFQWGKVYVLDTQQGALVKRVFEDKESKDNIICRSENSTDYPDFALPKIEIRSLSIVVGVIRME